MTPAYRYKATLLRAVDGDTLLLDVDLGFTVHGHVTVRLRDIDTPERNTPPGQAAKAAVHLLLDGKDLIVESYKGQQTFARWVADVYLGGVSVAETLKAGGHVK